MALLRRLHRSASSVFFWVPVVHKCARMLVCDLVPPADCEEGRAHLCVCIYTDMCVYMHTYAQVSACLSALGIQHGLGYT
jgi:hypothetical protein